MSHGPYCHPPRLNTSQCFLVSLRIKSHTLRRTCKTPCNLTPGTLASSIAPLPVSSDIPAFLVFLTDPGPRQLPPPGTLSPVAAAVPPHLPNSSFSLFTYQLKHHIFRETFSALPDDFSPSSLYISEPISLSNITVCKCTFVFVVI